MGVWSWLYRNVKDASLMKKVGIFLLGFSGSTTIIMLAVFYISSLTFRYYRSFIVPSITGTLLILFYSLIVPLLFFYWLYIIFYKVPKKP